MRIGIFSGTFDPVHAGHVAFASDALAEANLNKVVFLPEAKPRRKAQVSTLNQRLEMLRLAVAEKTSFEVYRCQSPSHSVNRTMEEIHSKYGKDNDYFLLMGVDVFEHIENWPNHKQLLADNSIILALRTEDDGEVALTIAERLKIEPEMIVSSFPAVSSSKIRRAIKDDEDAEGLTEEVLDYAINHRLYE